MQSEGHEDLPSKIGSLVFKVNTIYTIQYIQILTFWHQGQSVANDFSDEQIQIWILFAKDIFYDYKYEYYSGHLGSGIWIRKLFINKKLRINCNIQIYSNIWK